MKERIHKIDNEHDEAKLCALGADLDIACINKYARFGSHEMSYIPINRGYLYCDVHSHVNLSGELEGDLELRKVALTFRGSFCAWTTTYIA